MKYIIILIVIFNVAFAQRTESEQTLKDSQGKLITFIDIKTAINGDIETRTATYSRKISNATKFFPDNICLPVAPKSLKNSVASLTFRDLNQELKVLIESTKKSFEDKFQIKQKEITIIAAATAAKATSDIPGNPGDYSQQQVDMCYGGQPPSNSILAKSRAENLKKVLEKYLGKYFNENGVTLKTKTLLNRSTRYVKVEGLEFSKTITSQKMVGQVPCGTTIKIENGKKGNPMKNFLFQDLPGLSVTDYTRSILVKGRSSINVDFQPAAIPDKYEIYGVPEADKTKRVRLDKNKNYFGLLVAFQNNNGIVEESHPYNFAIVHQSKAANYTPTQAEKDFFKSLTADFIAKKTDPTSYMNTFSSDNDMVSSVESYWENLLKSAGVKNPAVEFKRYKANDTYDLKNKGYSHVVIKVFSPFDGTFFTMNPTCN